MSAGAVDSDPSVAFGDSSPFRGAQKRRDEEGKAEEQFYGGAWKDYQFFPYGR